MKSAVDKVGKGKGRIVNACFGVMSAHHLFDADICDVASGWEKGAVEKNVQDSRRRIWIEVQTASSSAVTRYGASCAIHNIRHSAWPTCSRSRGAQAPSLR